MEDENSPALRAGVDFRGTKNATQPVLEHIRPGKKRAPFLRYIRINLPRATRLLLVAVVAVIGTALRHDCRRSRQTKFYGLTRV